MSARVLEAPFSEGGGSFVGGIWHPPPAGFAIDIGFVRRWSEADKLAIRMWALAAQDTRDGVFITSALMARSETFNVTVRKGLATAERRGCVAAAYEIGRALQFAGNYNDASLAYLRAEANGHIGGLVGLLSLEPTKAEEVELLRRLVIAVLSPDCLARAQSLGAVAILSDAVWAAAEHLRFGGRSPASIYAHRATGGRPTCDPKADSLTADIERILCLGESLGDDFSSIARLEERCGLSCDTLQKNGLPSFLDLNICRPAEAIALCTEYYHKSLRSRMRAHAANCAAILLDWNIRHSGGAKEAEAIAWHVKSADEEKGYAGSIYKVYVALNEGIGLPRDPSAARRYLAKGVSCSVGPCMEILAEERMRHGDTRGAAELWERAASLDNFRAISVWEGISMGEAHARVFGPLKGPGYVDGEHRYRCRTCGAFGRLGAPVKGKVTAQWPGKVPPVVSTAPLLVACSGCRVALYCSKACQKSDWKAVGGHKAQCAGLGKAAEAHRQAEALPT